MQVYTMKPKGENKAVTCYIYLIGIMAIVINVLFVIKFRDCFVPGGGRIDRLAIDFIKGIRNDILSYILIFISKSGDTIIAIIFTILIMIYLYMINKKRESKFYAVNILAIAIVSQGVKFLSHRQRPEGEWLVYIDGYSFPSGHAVISMAGALILIYFIIRDFRRKALACIISVIMFIYAALIGLSRVYVGVHYISDVIGGWAIAFLWVFISLLIFTKRTVKNDNKYII